jgi:putative CocE/NonD family hydrolase
LFDAKLGDFDFGPNSIIDLNGYQLRWFNHWLKDEQNGIMKESAVNLFVMGKNEWVEENEWPISRTRWTNYYLHSDGHANSIFGNGVLNCIKPTINENTADTYVYDPKKPVPFITDMVSAQIGGPDDYTSIERRDDVLVYTSELMEEDTEVTGPIKIQLFAASSSEDTDFTAKLLDVHPNGYSQRLTDGMVRARFRDGMDKPKWIEANKVYEYQIDCWNTSNVFKKGHRIRLEISSSAFPKYDRNLNTKTALGQTSEMVAAKQTIHHSEFFPSAIILPIIPTRV